MKININPKEELFRWGPIDGKILYLYYFTEAFTKYAGEFVSWPDCLGFYYKEKSAYVLSKKNLVESGKKNFWRFVMNDQKFHKYYRQWNNQLKDFLSYQNSINESNLSLLTNQKFFDAYKKWEQYYLEFWRVGFIPEISNWGGEVILKEELEKIVPADKFNHLYERLSAPEQLSFYQQADLDLARLYPYLGQLDFEKKMSDYVKKYFWILSSYHHSRILDEKYFTKELKKLTVSKAKKQIKELTVLKSAIKKEKQLLINKYRLPKKVVKIADRVSFCVWWQDVRKYYIFLANHHLDLFLHEATKRYQTDFESLHYYTIADLNKLLKTGQKVADGEIKRRYNFSYSYYSEKLNKVIFVSDSDARKIYGKYFTFKIKNNVTEIQGVVVSRGKPVTGRVRIVATAREVGKMKSGDILVTSMTSPEFIVGMKKAKAIITDEGGMTCHAAIVSRELKIPCLVGTKIASKVFRDGDLVEVDTKKGIVKKL